MDEDQIEPDEPPDADELGKRLHAAHVAYRTRLESVSRRAWDGLERGDEDE